MRRGKYAKKDQYLNRLGEAVGDMAQMQESKLLDNWFTGENKQNNAHILGSTIFGDDFPPDLNSFKKHQRDKNSILELPIQNWATEEEINRFKSRLPDDQDDTENHSLISFKNWKPKNSYDKKAGESPNELMHKNDSEMESKKKLGNGLSNKHLRSEINEINSITNMSYKNIFHPTNPFAINYSGINSFVDDDEPRRDEKPILQKGAFEYIFGPEKKAEETDMKKSNRGREEEKDKRNRPPIFEEDSE